MARRRRAKVALPNEPGLEQVTQAVAEERVEVAEDPWGEPVMRQIFKSWADSFADSQVVGKTADEPDGPDYWLKAEVEDVDFDIHFRLGKTDEGALVVTGMLLGNPGGTQAITTSNLHKLPIGAIYEAVTAIDDITPTLAEKAREFKGSVPTRGGQRSSNLEFVRAAQHYKQCVIERPNDPIKCVADRLGVSNATASRRVSRARDMRMLKAPDSVLDKMEVVIRELEAAAQAGDSKAHSDLQTELYALEEQVGVPANMRKGIPF
jgi:hypothetical protein